MSLRCRCHARIVTLLSCIMLSCSDTDAGVGTAGGPRLILLDTIPLRETGDVFVGKASSLAVGSDQRFFIGDLFARRVLVFDSGGNLVSTIGKPGAGPGELMAPSRLVLYGDSTLYVVDNAAVEFEAFDARTGALRWSRLFPNRLSVLWASGSNIFAGYTPPNGRHTVARFSNAIDSVSEFGPYPRLLEHPALRDVFGVVVPTAIGDTLVTAYEVSDYIYLTDLTTGRLLDSVRAAPLGRKGARVDLMSRVLTDINALQDAIYKSSAPVALEPLSDSRLAYVTMDWKWENNRVLGTNFLTLVDLRRRQVCGDSPVPGPTDPLPRAALRGDTLYVLVQDVVEDRAATAIVRYRINARACEWKDAQ